MSNCHPVKTPADFGLKLHSDRDGKKVNNTSYKQIVGNLMYLLATRLEIMHSVNLISRYMENHTQLHLLAAKRILRYLQGAKGYRLFYKKGENSDLITFIDNYYAGHPDDRKSKSGYVFMIGSTTVSCHQRSSLLLNYLQLKLSLF